MLIKSFWIGSVLAAATIVAGAAVYGLRNRFAEREESPVAVVQRKVSKLGIETPARKTLAPEFVLQDTAGKQVSLRELRGKVVFLNFWATWCPPCIQEMPAMEKLHRQFEKDGLVILAVNFQESADRVRDFFLKHHLTFTALLDPDAKVFELYQAWALPASVIINKRGEIAGKAVGAKDWYSAEARQYFQQLIAETT
ncbi:MAG TPA: TlpA disulfide reductase family protein [Candidatus Eisenbacteria bacterium]|nr:TlpA disulfide reductase family protein [Candidatus Eisenbacteria bacterium]